MYHAICIIYDCIDNRNDKIYITSIIYNVYLSWNLTLYHEYVMIQHNAELEIQDN